MNPRRILVWSILFFGLLLYVILFERGPQKPRGPAPERTEARVFPCSAEQVRSIEIVRGTQKLRLVKSGRGWVTDPGCDRLGEDHLASFAGALTDSTVLDTIPAGDADVGQFGLASPWAKVSVQCEGRDTPIELLLGAQTPSQISMYAKIAGRDGVILIGTYLRFSLNTLMDGAGLK